MSERILLDPAAVASADRTEFDITPWVRWEGVEWDELAAEHIMVEQDIGSIPVGEPKYPNRVARIPLNIMDLEGKTFAEVRSELLAIVSRWQAAGGWLGHTVGDRTLYADVQRAAFRPGGSSSAALQQVDPDAELVVEYLPDWYEEEWVELDVMSGTGEIVGVLREGGRTAVIRGNFPRGNRCRIVIRDTSGNDQRGLICALRGRNYDSAATAALSYEAEALKPLDAARTAALTGTSGSTVIEHANLGTDWTPVLGFRIASDDSYLTHVGLYRLRARLRVPATGPAAAVHVRAVYDVGDLVRPTENRAWTATWHSAFFDADLGELRLDRAGPDPHRWTGQIQARGDLDGKAVQIDKVWLIPADEYMEAATARSHFSPGLAAYVVRDDFSQSAGALSGKSATIGGTWSGTGDADDFTVDGNGLVTRAATSDAGSQVHQGRLALAGSTRLAAVAVSLDYMTSRVDPLVAQGVILRYADVNNFTAIYVYQFGAIDVIVLAVRTAGVYAGGALATIPSLQQPGVWNTMTVIGDLGGSVYVWLRARGVGADEMSVLFPGLAPVSSGLVGMFDRYVGSDSVTRTYNNFRAWTPTFDATIYAGRACRLQTEGFERQDATGVAYSTTTAPVGNRPRLPLGSTVEVLARWSRGDLAALPDAGLDSGALQVAYRPCYLAAR